MKKPKISVIVPVYNSEKTILELLQALNEQTEKNFELVIIDDGSRDNSMALVKKYTKIANYPLRVFFQKNSGPASARNAGVKKARSNLILFLDSDCVPKINFVEKMIEPFKDNTIVGVQGEYETKNKYSWVARYIGYEMAYRQQPMKKAERIDHIATHAGAYRKKDFGKGFLTTFKKADMEDIELSYRIAKTGKRLVFQTEARIKHPHPESFFKFVKQQYGRGYWRAFGHMEHPDKLVKDSYLGNSIAIQGGLSILFLVNLVLYLIMLFFNKKDLFYLPLFWLLILYISNIPLGIFCYNYEKKMLILAPAIAIVRSLAATLGFCAGFIAIIIENRFK